MRKLIIVAVLLAPAAVLGARVWSRRERVELNATRATAFNGVITGQLPACTNWRQGFFRKECAAAGVKVGDLLPNGTCATGAVVTTLYPDCRYTLTTLTDYQNMPDGLQLETE